MRTDFVKEIAAIDEFKRNLLAWSLRFDDVVFLDSNNFPQKYGSYDCIFAAEALTSIKCDTENAFERLKEYQQTISDWIFGYLTYDLKNDIEALKSENFDGLDFPDLFFFQPKRLMLLKGNHLHLRYLNMCADEIEDDLDQILQLEPTAAIVDNRLQVSQRISKPDYLLKVSQMLEHIQLGDIYEANFCMEFYSENADLDVVTTFQKLNRISEPPFAAFFKHNFQYALSASPERYLRKENDKIISQPIKGTAKRSTNIAEDEMIAAQLSSNEKERSENIMIVDLVRNDLSRTAEKGSVEVEELCKVYSFKQVHHLISTVSSKSVQAPVDILRATFPMGSMTGAPKISAMNIIEKLEETKRGLYSGAIGYFMPNGDFDFNVVIRTILYNARTRFISFSVGSAITSLSDPESEYDECLLKAKAMLEVLSD